MVSKLTLEKVAEAFQIWRSNKAGRKTIPANLWNMVNAIAEQHGISEITKRLKISYSQYKNKVANPTINTVAATSTSTQPQVTFVDVTPLVAEQKPVLLEFVRKDGASAKCHCPDQSFLQNTLSWFLRSA